MIRSIERDTLVETLLNSLEAERYVRSALLLNVVDELAASDRLAPAAATARDLLEQLESGRITDGDFRRQLAELRLLVRRLGLLARATDRPRPATAAA